MAYGARRSYRRRRPSSYRRKGYGSRSRMVAKRYRGRYRRSGMWGRFAGTSAAPSRPELKFFDNNSVLAALTPTSGFVFTSINQVPQGVTENDRVGVKITVKSIFVQGRILLPQVTLPNNTSNRVRLMLILDKQANGGPAAILNNVINPVVDGMRDVAFMSQFTVLKTWWFSLDPDAGGSSILAEKTFPFKCYKNVHIPLRFDGATGGITELATNNIFLAAWTESADPIPLLTCQTRIRYADN